MKLLIGYDGSACSMNAINELRHAGLPPVLDAVVLTAADVWPWLLDASPYIVPPGSQATVERTVRAAKARAEKAMSDARSLAQRGAARVARLFPEWHVRAEAVADGPNWAIIQRAAQLHADLIVVGSHGYSALHRTILGSVSQSVLHHAPCSVRIARRVSAAEPRPVRLLLGVDGSVDSATAVAAVAGRNWPEGSEARVVAAVDLKLALLMYAAGSATTIAPQFRTSTHDDDERGHTARMVEMVAQELRDTGLTVTTAVRDGDPKRVLLYEAHEWAADCIFVGSQGLSHVERLLMGSVSSAVAARAKCTVEVVRFPVTLDPASDDWIAVGADSAAPLASRRE